MTNLQKSIILLFLFSFSLIFHMTFCEWSTPDDYRNSGYYAQPIFGSIDDFDKTLLYADRIIFKDNITALVVGVFLPLALIGYAMYLYLGWRSEIDNLVKETILKINNHIKSKSQDNEGDNNSLK